jgi:hypothetical protein
MSICRCDNFGNRQPSELAYCRGAVEQARWSHEMNLSADLRTIATLSDHLGDQDTCDKAADRIKALEAALQNAEKGFDRIHKALLSTGPKQACGEMVLHFLTETRAAITQLESSQ